MKFQATTEPWVIAHASSQGDAVINQGYTQGSAVTLKVVFFDTSGAPVTPASVTLRALVLNKVTSVTTNNTFTAPMPGTYTTVIDTTGFSAGAYTWRFLAIDGGGRKFYGEDEFVLLPFTGPNGP
jgi:hypothetical protein